MMSRRSTVNARNEAYARRNKANQDELKALNEGLNKYLAEQTGKVFKQPDSEVKTRSRRRRGRAMSQNVKTGKGKIIVIVVMLLIVIALLAVAFLFL